MKPTDLLIFPIILFLTACQSGPDSSRNVQAPVLTGGTADMKPNIPESMGDSTVSLTVERDVSQSAINVHINKNNDSFKILSLQRQNMITGEKIEIPFEGAEIVDRLVSVRADLRPWHFKYIAQTDRGQVTGVIRVLKDLRLVGYSRISEFQFESNHIELRHLDLRQSGGFFTEGRDLQIDVETLQAGSQSMIQTFDVYEAARSEVSPSAGTGGGTLRLNIRWATGPLEISMRGRVGAPGGKGANAPQERPPQTGRGQDAVVIPGTPRGLDYPGEKPSCGRNATNGDSGTPGLDGADGFDGYAGGDSGSVHLNVKSADQFTYKISLQAGSGGLEGAPGKGQPGGYGGDPGASGALCKHKASKGSMGEDGKEGKFGKRGLDGALGEVCVTLAATPTPCVSQSQVSGGF